MASITTSGRLTGYLGVGDVEALIGGALVRVEPDPGVWTGGGHRPRQGGAAVLLDQLGVLLVPVPNLPRNNMVTAPLGGGRY